jgi:hypothetical protein
MAAERFLCSDGLAGDMAFPDVESILDAIEAALVSADTPLFDTVRQSWQPVAMHPEVRKAWLAREGYRPPGSSPLALPTLPAPRPADDDEDIALRRAAWAKVRGRTGPTLDPPVRNRRIVAAAALFALTLLALVGWAVVAFAVKLGKIAGAMMTENRER